MEDQHTLVMAMTKMWPSGESWSLLVLLLVLFLVDVDVIVLLWSTMSLFLVVFG